MATPQAWFGHEPIIGSRLPVTNDRRLKYRRQDLTKLAPNPLCDRITGFLGPKMERVGPVAVFGMDSGFNLNVV